jgi:hypothetical protein
MKKAGRPHNQEGSGDKYTKMVRLPTDLAEKLGWLVRLSKEKKTAAQIVDPMIRPQIEARYEKIRAEVEDIKRSEHKAKNKPGHD